MQLNKMSEDKGLLLPSVIKSDIVSLFGKGLMAYIKNYHRLEMKTLPYKFIKSNSYLLSQ